ncbi:hypothetical protein [Streptomyces sp. NPDC088261]|uniref:hypothetical protein n=1 Tax=Streptomyces sp. NPDC088261 TaxID=3365851 RepID=UPI00380EA40C
MSDDYERLGGSANPDLVPACWIRKSGGTVAAEIEFGMATEQAVVSTSKVPNLAHYDAGRGAFANGKFTYLYFDCVGPKLAGSSDSDPAVVFGKLRNAVQSGEEDEPADGPGPIREANLTVLHSVAYKLAQELGCRGDGGLTEKVTLTTGS